MTKKSSHPDLIQLQHVADHEVQPAEVLSHIETCDHCRAAVDRMRRDNDALKERFRMLPDMPDKTADIMTAIRRLQPQPVQTRVQDLPVFALIPFVIMVLGMVRFLYLVLLQPAWYERFGLFLSQLSAFFNLTNVIGLIGQFTEPLVVYQTLPLLQVSIPLFALFALIYRTFMKRGYKHV